jgi:hypothetical protein
MILVFALLVWVPRIATHPVDLTGNWLKDLGLAGGALVLPARPAVQTPWVGAALRHRSESGAGLDELVGPMRFDSVARAWRQLGTT